MTTHDKRLRNEMKQTKYQIKYPCRFCGEVIEYNFDNYAAYFAALHYNATPCELCVTKADLEKLYADPEVKSCSMIKIDKPVVPLNWWKKLKPKMLYSVITQFFHGTSE